MLLENNGDDFVPLTFRQLRNTYQWALSRVARDIVNTLKFDLDYL